ncbi:MAG: CFI-box-CTERM domain-containing protein, partial [Candidatus Omnitrophota bacterium]
APENVARYQWDTNGNGEYDYSAPQSSSVTISYDEVLSKSCNTYFRVVNNNGLGDLAWLRLNVNADKWYKDPDWVYRPKVLLTDYFISTYAGDEVVLEGSGAPMGYLTYGQDKYGYIKKLEWDFESDGDYDYVVELNNSTWKYGTAKIEHNYGVPGMYKATLKVTDDTGKTATDYCIVMVAYRGVPPQARAEVSYKEVTGATVIEDAKLPLSVSFDHSLSSGVIMKYEWDFNGDKCVDFVTTSGYEEAVYHYMYPGSYTAELIVTDIDGLKDSFYVPVFVACPDVADGYSSYISVPFNGAKVAGNFLTLCSYVYPDDVTAADVVFQYRQKGTLPWNVISGTTNYLDFYKVNWDTTSLTDGIEYELRTIIKDGAEYGYEEITVVISNLDYAEADIVENYSGTFFKSIKLNTNQSSSIIIPNSVQIDIPLGAVKPEDSSSTITITERLDEKADVGSVIDISGLKEFSKDIIITIPYPDADNNGIVDGTNIDETTLKVRWLNEETHTWEPIYDSIVYFGENYVSAKVNHLSMFGLFSAIISVATPAGVSSASEAGGGGSASYCFIATAAYGTPMAGDVMVLRSFRDKVLLKSELGKALVRFYYKHSPEAASIIREKPVLRRITRALLKPLVEFAKFCNKK